MNRRKPQNRPKPPPKPAARSAPPPRLGVRAWREQHLYGLFSSLGRLAARPWATLMTLLVMGLALALPLLLELTLVNAQQLHGDLREAGAISAFLKPGLDKAAVDAAAQRVRALDGVAAVAVRTPEQGLAEFRAASGLADALAVLHDNPLPAVLLVTPRDRDPTALESRLRSDAAVDLVLSDANWRQRLDAILALATRAAAVLAALLALALLLVIGNTIRLDVLGRAEEIAVMQLLGASNGFIRRPFLYAGLWYGAGSAVVALAVIAAVEAALSAPVQQLVASYDHRFVVHGLAWQPLALAVAAAALLGWTGAWIAATRQLRPRDN